MTEHNAPSPPRPTLAGALRGIWLFTWKPQIARQRLPLLVLGLLVLPTLVYFTTSSPATWSPRQGPSDAGTQFDEFTRRLSRGGIPLQSDQKSRIQQIFTEEFARAEASIPETQSAEANTTRQRDEIRACFNRIRGRVQPVLDERQFAQFQTYEKRTVPLLQQRVKPVWNRTAPFYHWLIDFYFFVILPLQCVRGSGGLIRDELQADTLGFLLTRPLSRARLLVVKYIAQTAWLQIVLLAETVLLFVVGGLRHIPGLGSLLPLFLAAQFLAVFAWSAVGIFFGQVSKRYVALALLYGLIVEMGIGRIPTNINTLSLMRHLKTLLAHNPALQAIYEWTGTSVPLSLTALALAAGLFLGLAALLFTFKEYHHTAEMQK